MDPFSVAVAAAAFFKTADRILDLVEYSALPRWWAHREREFAQAREANLVREGRQIGPNVTALVWEILPSPGMFRAGWEGPFFVCCPQAEGAAAPRAWVAARLLSSLWMTDPKGLGALLRAQDFGEAVKGFLAAKGLPPETPKEQALAALLHALALPTTDLTPGLVVGLTEGPLLMIDRQGEYYPRSMPPAYILAGRCRNTVWKGDEVVGGTTPGRHIVQL